MTTWSARLHALQLPCIVLSNDLYALLPMPCHLQLGLSKLSKEQRRESVVAALTAFKKFGCYPEQVDALLYFTEAEVRELH